MITDFFIGLITTLLRGVSALLPDWSIDLPSPGALIGWLEQVNYFVPIGELLSIALAMLLLGLPMLAASIVLWGIALVRGGSSRG